MQTTNLERRMKEDDKELKTYYKGLHKRIDILFKKEKGLFKTRKSLRKPIEPVAFVLRKYGICDIYEGVTGDTFIIPKGSGELKAKQQFVFSDSQEAQEKKKGDKVVYLSGRNLFEIPWGVETVKAYFLNEDDAVPLLGDTRVWSERLEYTIDAILLNFERYKRKNDTGGLDWTWKLAIAIAGGVALVFAVRGMWPNAFGSAQAAVAAAPATTAPGAIPDGANLTVGTVLGG